MNHGRTVFAQLFECISHNDFYRCVNRYGGDYRSRRLSCWQQFLAIAFAQFTSCESLRDIEVCLAAQGRKLYHSGFTHPVRRSTLAEANEHRDWRIFADFAQILIARARELYADEDLGLDLQGTIYALDSSTVDLCLSLLPWAHFRRAKGAIKLHTLLDLRGSIPAFLHVTHGKVHDVAVLDELTYEPGSYLVMDRGYLDFQRLYIVNQAAAFFVIRAKSNLQFHRRYSHPIDKQTGVRSDQTVLLTGPKSSRLYPAPLRRVSFYAADIDKRFVFLSNNFVVSSPTIAALYRSRWQVELFFKWIKQHLRIKRFLGTTPNSVKVQIWVAVSAYVVVAIVKKILHLPHSLYTILQALSVTLFEKTPIQSVFSRVDIETPPQTSANQLELFRS